MNPTLLLAIKELKDFALTHQHKAPARGYIRRWLIDLIEWEDVLESGDEFPALKFYKIKKYLYRTYL